MGRTPTSGLTKVVGTSTNTLPLVTSTSGFFLEKLIKMTVKVEKTDRSNGTVRCLISYPLLFSELGELACWVGRRGVHGHQHNPNKYHGNSHQ